MIKIVFPLFLGLAALLGLSACEKTDYQHPMYRSGGIDKSDKKK